MRTTHMHVGRREGGSDEGTEKIWCVEEYLFVCKFGDGEGQKLLKLGGRACMSSCFGDARERSGSACTTCRSSSNVKFLILTIWTEKRAKHQGGSHWCSRCAASIVTVIRHNTT